MRLVEIKLKCGWLDCETVGLEGEGLVMTRVLNIHGRPVEVDICKNHSDELDETVAPLLADGRYVEEPTKQKKKTTGGSKVKHATVDLDCKYPGCDRNGDNPLKNTAGMAQHVIRTHGYDSLEAYHEEYPPSG